MRNDIITGDFTDALRDYAYLINQRYPRKSILKVVGDRYMLNTYQRAMLSRGVFPDADIRSRIRKIRKSIKGAELHVDAFNILFTISNYLLGRLVFIANDHFVRDTGEVDGKPLDDPVFLKSMDLCIDYLAKSSVSSVDFLFDSPIPHSAEIAGMFREKMSIAGMPGEVLIDRNPDAVLIRLNSGMIASSDSVILDQTELPLTDLACAILEANYNLNLPDLGVLLS